MVDTALLRAKIKESKITICAIAEKMGISRESLYKKIKNVREFKTSEIQKISTILSLSDSDRSAIFFSL